MKRELKAMGFLISTLSVLLLVNSVVLKLVWIIAGVPINGSSAAFIVIGAIATTLLELMLLGEML